MPGHLICEKQFSHTSHLELGSDVGARHGFSPSSIDINTFPSGDNAIERIFFRFSKGKVRDLFLNWPQAKIKRLNDVEEAVVELELSVAYPTKSKTDTRFPTGLRIELPSGVKTTFPCR